MDSMTRARLEDPKVPSQLVQNATDTNFTDDRRPPPLMAKLAAVLLISLISFASHWSAGITGAMKSTIKKELHVSNTQFSLLEASEDFMATFLLLGSGIVTDRVGGAAMIVYGTAVYTFGSILVAAATTVQSFDFMVGGRIILALGDIATQVAQYKMFSSWFAPNNGFASTLGLELAIGKIGGFVGKSTANIIAQRTGNFAWAFWVSVFINLFGNASTAVFWAFSRYCNKAYRGRKDLATHENLTEKNRRFEVQKVFLLPWMFWLVLLFSLFQTSVVSIFNQNSTELAEKRFNVDSITAGWYSALAQYAGTSVPAGMQFLIDQELNLQGFFLVPCVGVFIDIFGNRATVLLVCGIGMLLSMVLVNFASTPVGTAASFGIYAIASTLGPTSIIDSIRTTLWEQSIFGTAYALKVTMNNAMSIVIRIITGALQDADDDSYRRVVRVYLFLAASSVVIGLTIFLGTLINTSLAPLQWTRKQRATIEAKLVDLVVLFQRPHVTDHGKLGCIYLGGDHGA
ncbi:hypothetical protein FE257_008354 [Aspergillus nanangensis]|uniref:Lysosomal dipeptide transporter MFSD1 n=1 Tax=Aspergillus nanangensis TaxID=2582783 RepID=A0AAD4GUT7_ASPNN|nr:hypothetical protein FE257_008354 [Aspergillus nanangensis]